MKVKSAHETACIGKGHKYLGHYAKAKHINRGHNSSGKIDPYEGAQRENKLKGDEPTLKEMDDKLDIVKVNEKYEELVRRHQMQKEIDREVDDLVERRRKQYRMR